MDGSSDTIAIQSQQDGGQCGEAVAEVFPSPATIGVALLWLKPAEDFIGRKLYATPQGRKCPTPSACEFHETCLAPQATPAAVDAWRDAVNEAKEAELFDDGVEADLHDQGIHGEANAYMAGRQDVIAEIEQIAAEHAAALAAFAPPLAAPPAEVKP